MLGSSRSNSGEGEGTLAKVLRALRLAVAAARPRSSASAAISRKPGTRGGPGGGGVFSKLRRVGRSPGCGRCGAALAGSAGVQAGDSACDQRVVVSHSLINAGFAVTSR